MNALHKGESVGSPLCGGNYHAPRRIVPRTIGPEKFSIDAADVHLRRSLAPSTGLDPAG